MTDRDEDQWDDDSFRRGPAADEASTDVDETGVQANIDWGDMMRFKSVKEVTGLIRSSRMLQLIRKLAEYNSQPPKNAIPKDDPEHAFLCECSEVVLQIEVEKSKANKFIRDHYAIRFPELSLFIQDSVTYAKVVKLIQNNLSMVEIVGELDELIPSQLTVVIIAAASTTQGRELNDEELAGVVGAAQELQALEDAKQLLLEYIQQRMPLVCPNLCAFLGSGLVSQLFAMTSSVTKISMMDPVDLANLGSRRGATGGVNLKTVGFLMNCDLVAHQQPQLRPKALRLVATAAVNLARIDDNRRASDNSQGLKQRDEVKRKMIAWTDPVGVRGAGNNTYERRTRKRSRRDEFADRTSDTQRR